MLTITHAAVRDQKRVDTRPPPFVLVSFAHRVFSEDETIDHRATK